MIGVFTDPFYCHDKYTVAKRRDLYAGFRDVGGMKKLMPIEVVDFHKLDILRRNTGDEEAVSLNFYPDLPFVGNFPDTTLRIYRHRRSRRRSS